MLVKTIALVLGFTAVWASSSKKFFRRDYVYNEVHDAFYKLHWGGNSKTWQEAFITCGNEGAKLFYPEALEEWKVVTNLTDLLEDVESIFVGVRDEFGQGDFLTVEGRFVPEFSKYSTNGENGESKCAVISVRTGSYSVELCKQKKPFICKRIDDESCSTIDSAYMYSKAMKKCYKVNKIPSTWQDAFHRCIIEGGILLNPTKGTESILHSLIKQEQLYFIGIRRMLPQSAFYSVLGSTFEMFDNEQNRENCMAVKKIIISDTTNYSFREYNSENKILMLPCDCNTTLPFICEMQVKI